MSVAKTERRAGTPRLWQGIAVGLLLGAALGWMATTTPVWRSWLRSEPPAAPILPASIAPGNDAIAVQPPANLVFLDMSAPYLAMAESFYDGIWAATYLWHPDRPLHPRETRQVVGGPISMLETLDAAAADAGWGPDERFRHSGWSVSATGYERDGYVLVAVFLGRRAARATAEDLVIGAVREEWDEADVLPVAIFTNLPRPDNPNDAPWLSPEAQGVD